MLAADLWQPIMDMYTKTSNINFHLQTLQMRHMKNLCFALIYIFSFKFWWLFDSKDKSIELILRKIGWVICYFYLSEKCAKQGWQPKMILAILKLRYPGLVAFIVECFMCWSYQFLFYLDIAHTHPHTQ